MLLIIVSTKANLNIGAPEHSENYFASSVRTFLGFLLLALSGPGTRDGDLSCLTSAGLLAPKLGEWTKYNLLNNTRFSHPQLRKLLDF